PPVLRALQELSEAFVRSEKISDNSTEAFRESTGLRQAKISSREKRSGIAFGARGTLSMPIVSSFAVVSMRESRFFVRRVRSHVNEMRQLPLLSAFFIFRSRS